MKTKDGLILSDDVSGYTILRKPGTDALLELFRSLATDAARPETEGDITEKDGYRKVLFHDGRCRCWLVEFRGKKYLFKLDRRDRHRADYLVVQSFFLGSNAFRLMRTLHRAFLQGFRGAAEIFLTADKRCFGCVLHSFFLQEWVEGKSLKYAPLEFYEKYSAEAAGIIRELHRFGCAHGDAHRGNFILETSSGHLKSIDIGGKVPNAQQKATDRIRLEKEWGVKNELFDWGYYWVRMYQAWRHFSLRKKLFRR